MEVGDRALHAVVPGRVGRRAAHARAALALGYEPAVHRRADLVEFGHHQRIVIEVERVAERRDEHHHAHAARSGAGCR